MDEDKVDSLNDFRDENDEGFREDNIDNDEDVEEDREPGRDMKPEPPPQPPLYRPSRPPIKLSFLGTTSFELRTNKGLFGVVQEDRSVFRNQDLKKINELKSHFYYWHDYYYNEYLEEKKEEKRTWTPDWSALTASHFIVFYREIKKGDLKKKSGQFSPKIKKAREQI